MRARTLLLISLVLNVALFSALVTWLSSTPENTPRVVRPINAAVVLSNQPVRIIKTNILVRPRTFTWQEVETPDYAVYVENLRALGMPERTVRDIIVADVDQIFLQRLREGAELEDMEWWRSTPSFANRSNTLARTQQIDRERQALLVKLLGPDWEQGRPQEDEPAIGLAGPVLGNLPEEVKAQVQEISLRSRRRMSEFVAEAQALGQPLDPLAVTRLRDETRQQLAAVLPPVALEEFLLRYAESANQLRRELTGFNATPEEFRALFRAVDVLDRERFLRQEADDAGSQRALAALEQQRLLAIRASLSPERFAVYQTLTDPAYREAFTVAMQLGGDGDTALALYEIVRASDEQLNRLRNDPTLTEAQRRQLMREAEAEQLRARAKVLGGSPAAEAPPSVPPVTAAPVRAHEIVWGETLPALAWRYRVSMSAIREANPGLDLNRAQPGTVIVMPPPDPAPPAIYPPGVLPRRP